MLLSKSVVKSYLFNTCAIVVALFVSCNYHKSGIETNNRIPDIIDFNYHVKPILSDRCYACHGPDEQKRKAELRFDTPENAFEKLTSGNGRALVAGKPGKSEVYHRIFSNDPEQMMPPPESNLALSEEEKAIIVKWIKQGAKYKPHWAFIKPEKSTLPVVQKTDWPKNAIDNFVLAQLENIGLTPSDKASKETLIRRLSFDLTGLPPTLVEIDQFLADDDTNAYEKLVDRLLQSNAYGERMASVWMDLARYTDSDGYLDDKHRDFSPWRDWVIEAFNENMPYDRFATWQLAGDLIPNPTQESILATAFNRLHRKNSEAGIIFEEFRVEYVADRVQTMGQTFLGLSLECARCHDHKFDPVSQEDFYKISGFFNSTNEIGTAVYGPDQTPGPSLLLTTEEEQNIIKFINHKVEDLETKLKDRKATHHDEYQNWQSEALISSLSLGQQIEKHLVAHYPFDAIKISADGKTSSPNSINRHKPARLKEPLIQKGKQGNAYFASDYNSVSLSGKVGWYDRTDPFSISFWVYPDTIYQEAGIFYHCENIRLGYKGYSLHMVDNKLRFIMAHSWPSNSIQITTKEALPVKEWSQITITYDGSSKASGASLYVNGKPSPVSIDQDHLYKGILYEYDIHTYGYDGFSLGQRQHIIPFKNGGIDELQIYDGALSALESLYLFSPTAALAVVKNKEDDRHKQLLGEYYWAHFDTPSRVLRDSLKINRSRVNSVINEVDEIMVLGDLEEPRPTFVLDRGVYNARGKEVSPGVPEAVLPFNELFPKNRLGLAKWLFDDNNPLTARVLVNQIWQMHFGKGLVRTSEDFGNQGELPSHPKLLDWLAVTIMESGWDVKAFHKYIVMSATYQQSSVVRQETARYDPENSLLSRGPSFRLPAEMIRDHALAISGLLVNTVGGSSAYPYQPEGLWDELSNKPWRYNYLQQPGEGLYRRSLYTIWKRTSPPPSMLIFDAPERGVCTVRRRTTSTPLQALVLLNDPQYLEASRVLAERLLKKNQENIPQSLKNAFRLITGRTPDQKEVNMLSSFYEEELYRFKNQSDDAIAYLNVGESAWDNSIDPSKIAALATVSHSIMNTSEGYSRK